MTRSPLLIVIASVALVLAAGAIVLQFVLPSKGDGASAADVNALKTQVAAIKTGGAGLKVAFVNADTAFTVFTNAVNDLRQHATDKRQEITNLTNSYSAGTVNKDQYQKQLTQLNAELLDAQMAVDMGTLDRMIASSAFSDLKSSLEQLRNQADPVVTAIKNLVSMAKGGAIDATEFQTRYTSAQTAFTQVDALVTQAATAKIQQAAKKIAIQKGYDLVVPVKNVVVYYNPDTVTDITEFVKAEIANYL